jgi:hypothetical protein
VVALKLLGLTGLLYPSRLILLPPPSSIPNGNQILLATDFNLTGFSNAIGYDFLRAHRTHFPPVKLSLAFFLPPSCQTAAALGNIVSDGKGSPPAFALNKPCSARRNERKMTSDTSMDNEPGTCQMHSLDRRSYTNTTHRQRQSCYSFRTYIRAVHIRTYPSAFSYSLCPIRRAIVLIPHDSRW